MSRAQLLVAGLSVWQVKSMIRGGFLHREHTGVYVVGHQAEVELGRETAALLACGADAVLSHATAEVVWRIDPRTGLLVPVHVSTTHKKRSQAGITVHRTLHLDAVDIRIHEGLPVTSPARTLVDRAGELTARELERALDEALIQRLVSLKEVNDTLDRLPVRRNAALLRKLVNGRRQSTLTRSQLEEIFLELIRKAGLPMPKVNYRLHGFTVDFYWPQYKVAFELDGYQFHSSKSAFERDRRKDRILKQAGIDCNRVTYRELTDHPLEVVVHVTQRLTTADRQAA